MKAIHFVHSFQTFWGDLPERMCLCSHYDNYYAEAWDPFTGWSEILEKFISDTMKLFGNERSNPSRKSPLVEKV